MKKIILACAVLLLCFGCSEKKSTLEEEKKLQTLIEQSKGESGYDNSEIVVSLLTTGYHTTGSMSVAYLLLKNDSILIIAKEGTIPPFTKDEARLLLKSKLRDEMLLFD